MNIEKTRKALHMEILNFLVSEGGLASENAKFKKVKRELLATEPSYVTFFEVVAPLAKTNMAAATIKKRVENHIQLEARAA